MPTSLTPNLNNLKNSIQIPLAFVDQVSQMSVQPAFQALLDNTYTIVDKDVYQKPSLTMYSVDGANIVVRPFSGLWASKQALVKDYINLSKTTDTTLTSANVEGGGGFVANTIYYIYAIYDAAAALNTKIIICTDAPDSTRTWRVIMGDDQLNSRYIGSLPCFAGPATATFVMSDGDYRFTTSYNYGSYTAAVFTDAVVTLLPATATSARLKIVTTNTDAANDATVDIKAKALTSFMTIDVARKTDYVNGFTTMDLPAIGTPKNTFQVKVTGGTTSASFNWIGYKE